jgi:glycosyltransferase involved in cell wall biosynthesis
MPESLAVSVILCVRNGDATLREQLDALSCQDYPGNWEVIIVDNGSRDRSRAIALEARYRLPKLKVVDEPRPGVNFARNAGVRAARGDHLLFCDQDDIATGSWVRELASALDHYDVVGGAMEYDVLNSPDVPRRDQQSDALLEALGYKFSMGSNLASRRDVLNAVGGFDESFRRGSDDADFCLRAQYAGFSIGFAPAAVMHYRLKTTPRALLSQMYSYGRANENLAARHRTLGNRRSTALQRWKVTAHKGWLLFTHLATVRTAQGRLDYAGRVGFFVGAVIGNLRYNTAGYQTRSGSRICGVFGLTSAPQFLAPVDRDRVL